jgi:hypothetical protein
MKIKPDIILTLIFIILKLTNLINLNWIFIFFPMIIPVFIYIIIKYIKYIFKRIELAKNK